MRILSELKVDVFVRVVGGCGAGAESAPGPELKTNTPLVRLPPAAIVVCVSL
ncbi:hypothetical protein GCM10009716_03960 [Streptomyces sodiiphilus]|uniref:Uncharacterized protein n=1 Tax=Streptomyces sodiiphilus TaxID=226217 RepID=A0ABN2NR69_9ACTN